jgi:hypothetical protein
MRQAEVVFGKRSNISVMKAEIGTFVLHLEIKQKKKKKHFKGVALFSGRAEMHQKVITVQTLLVAYFS